MRNSRFHNSGLLTLLTAALLLTGCGRAPTETTDGSVGQGISNGALSAARPTLPTGVTAASITIAPASASIAIGDQLRFGVAVVGSDGQTYTDPRLVNWSLGDAQCGSLDDQGLFIPSYQRITTVRASLGDKFGEISVTITAPQYTWQQVQSPTNADLFGVQMVNKDEAWAVGAQGTMLHLMNGYWQQMTYPIPTTTQWRGIKFANAGYGWVVGHNGTDVDDAGQAVTLVYKAGNWYPISTNVSGALLGVAAINDTNAFAVGRDATGKVLIMRWNGSAWVRDTSYSGSGRLNAVQTLGSEAWAVGTNGSDALVLHYDGSHWSKVSLPYFFGTFSSSELKGIQMINSQQGYAVGRKTDLLGVDHGLMLTFDGRTANVVTHSNWSETQGASGATKYLDQVPLNGIGMLDANQGWVLGEVVSPNRIGDPAALLAGGTVNQVFGDLLSFNGLTYAIDSKLQSYNLAAKFQGIDLLPDGSGCIVGTKGYLMQRAFDWRNIRTGNPNATTATTTNPSGNGVFQ